MQTRGRWSAVVLAAGLLCLGAAGPGRAAQAALARREANFVRVEGAPTVLLWARGLSRPGDLDRYVECGLNTAYIAVPSATAEALATASALAAEAEARGLLVVFALAPLRGERGEDLAPDALSQAYVEAVSAFVQGVVARLGDHPRLIAWSVEAVPPQAVAWGDEGFRAYLEEWYGSLSAVNESWGTAFASWEEITVAGVRDVDSLLPAGLGRASVDFAYYREAAYADALSLWASALRNTDPGRLVFGGALRDYRSIISVRGDFDGLVLATYPSVAEADWDTHNVHAVDIGRRGNRFAVVQTLEVEPGVNPARLEAWVAEALVHGAAGIAFSNWPAIRASEQLQAAVRRAAHGLAAGFPAEPVARTAVLYQPIAGGAMRDGRSLYGYLDGMTPDQPTTLFAAARRGSRYGLLDVISLDSISAAGLRQYGAVIAPTVLYLPEEAQLALQNYVLQGGVFVADAGIGMYQAEGVMTSVPPILRDFLGLQFTDLAPSPEELRAEAGWPGYLGQPGQVGEPGVAIPMGPAERGEVVDPDVQRFADILSEFLSRTDVRRYLGGEFVWGAGPISRVRALGRGFSVYAPTFLYEAWRPADPYFSEFHNRILGWGSDLEMVQPADLWPPVSLAAYSDYSVAIASPEGLGAAVVVHGGAAQVYQVPAGAMRVANPEEDDRVELLLPAAPLVRAQPLPVFVRPLDPEAVATVVVREYGPQRVELLIYGTEAWATLRGGEVVVSGGAATQLQLEVGSGAYLVAPGAVHRVTIEEEVGRRRRAEREVMPSAETATLRVTETIRAARVVIEPAPAR